MNGLAYEKVWRNGNSVRIQFRIQCIMFCTSNSKTRVVAIKQDQSDDDTFLSLLGSSGYIYSAEVTISLQVSTHMHTHRHTCVEREVSCGTISNGPRGHIHYVAAWLYEPSFVTSHNGHTLKGARATFCRHFFFNNVSAQYFSLTPCMQKPPSLVTIIGSPLPQ